MLIIHDWIIMQVTIGDSNLSDKCNQPPGKREGPWDMAGGRVG